MYRIGRKWRLALALAVMAGLASIGSTAGIAEGATSLNTGCSSDVTASGPAEVQDTVYPTTAIGTPGHPNNDGATPVNTTIDVILPEGYCASSRAYPIIYMLHGAGGSYADWTNPNDGNLLSYVQDQQGADPSALNDIFVMPDGGAGGWYSNWFDGSRQYETYHLTDVLNYITQTYDANGKDMGIAGLSMGGFGALSYAARHPGMFRVAASFSGAVDMLYGFPASGAAFTALNSEYNTPTDAVWGNQITDESNWAAHNPASLAAQLKGTTLLLASGTGTPGGPQGDALDPTSPGFDPGGYALEFFIFQMNLSLVKSLAAAGVTCSASVLDPQAKSVAAGSCTTDFYPGGYHGWPYWRADAAWALPLMDQQLHS
jgi:diacylglycerol O-acyltransferase/trehalose O-mycolyltransferase